MPFSFLLFDLCLLIYNFVSFPISILFLYESNKEEKHFPSLVFLPVGLYHSLFFLAFVSLSLVYLSILCLFPYIFPAFAFLFPSLVLVSFRPFFFIESKVHYRTFFFLFFLYFPFSLVLLFSFLSFSLSCSLRSRLCI
uniref:Uncharacterized protein n=1 Tax=Cacopsylla melanoneura TaxID=428564 RepID=A0A8D8ZFC8_9HEMI